MTAFRRLWLAYAVSSTGTAIGYGALPLIALLVLNESTLRVSLLATLSALVSAVISLPFGTVIEYRRKRPVMIAMDALRFLALLSVPLLAVLNRLTYFQLCVVAVITTAATMAFTAASTAYLKALVPDDLAAANSRLESTFWLTNSAGPPLGGFLIGWIGATATVVVDAVSYAVSALVLRRVDAVEPAPEGRTGNSTYRSDLVAGWRYVWSQPDLRMLYVNSQLFGGAVMMTSPLLAVLMVRELGFSTFEFGLVIGVACVGGVIGAWLAPAMTRRLGARRVLLWSGLARSPWLLLLPLATADTRGLVVLLVAETGLVFCAGVFNPSFTTHRMRRTPDALMARVHLSWSISSRSVQPAFMALGGVLATAFGTPGALWVAGVCCTASAILLPWRVPVAEPALMSTSR